MFRDEITNYIECQFMGPPSGTPHKIEHFSDDLPYQQFITGMLFPQESELHPNQANQDVSVFDPDLDPLSLSYTYLTASAGISINISNNTKKITVGCSASIYNKETKENNDQKEVYWEKEDLKNDLLELTIEDQQLEVLDKRAVLNIRVFRNDQSKILTLTLINTATKEEFKKVNQEDVLCNVGLWCETTSESFLEYPKLFRSTSDDEEEEQQILYRDEKIFGIGHACSVNWEKNEDNEVKKISLDWIPKEYTKSSTVDLEEYNGSDSLDLSVLANPENKTKVNALLKDFIKPYELWMNKIFKELENLKKDKHFKNAEEIINKMKSRLELTLERIQSGIKFIHDDQVALKAFQFANLAMLMQMAHSSKYEYIKSVVNKGPEYFEKDYPQVDDFNDIDYFDLENDFKDDQKFKGFKWRPFQLAFLLLSIESTLKDDSDYRETVDLIWFATGGGKTEAYLFLCAVLIFYKKLMDPSHSGTDILMRYTLRLLSQDQFVRSSRFIVACEKIRRDHKTILGEHEIQIGLWIGGESIPNRYTQNGKWPGALQKHEELLENPNPNGESPFSIENCSWCGTNLVPQKNCDKKNYGFRATASSFDIFCPSKKCVFHNKLPIRVIDEDIYENPPTFILGTIDKFAQLAFEVKSGRILSSSGSGVSLIIQDELHLISGPLGTVTGAVEASFDVILKEKHVKPKYIAATATIRGAADQVQKLYARKANIFPPSGISHKDRFFSKVKENDPKARLYVGIMSQGHTPISTTVHISSALMQSVEEIQNYNDDEKDGYHTLVVYHNSRKEKSKTKVLATQDIPERIEQICSFNNKHSHETNKPRSIGENGVAELSSEVPKELFETKRRLNLERGHPNVIDIVSVTNIIQVGIDIQRLGVIEVIGQPRTSAEFIQATSRVGRGDYPGLVVVNYIASNPRDRSHYEQFKGYIKSVDRYVEPTSVTPAAEPSLKRTIPTCLVILAKHILGLSDQTQASKFDMNSNEVKSTIESFKERLKDADPDEAQNIERFVNEHVRQWDSFIRKNRGLNKIVYHTRHGKTGDPKYLTKDFGDTNNVALWDVLTSMRFVDTEVSLKIK